jgi:hypothetical protein
VRRAAAAGRPKAPNTKPLKERGKNFVRLAPARGIIGLEKGEDIMDKRLLVLIGAALLVVGVFLPIASVPPEGSLNLLLPGGSLGDGIFILVLALIGAALALAGKTRHAIWPAVLSLAFLVWKYFQIKEAVDHAHAVIAEIGGGSELANSVSDSMQMNMLGWAVLAIGALVMIAGAAMAWKGPSSAVPPTV